MEWKNDEQKYTSGSTLYLGRWAVGGSHYDAGKSRGNPLKYKATCALPGIKRELGHYETDELAKAKVESAVSHWLDGSRFPPSNA